MPPGVTMAPWDSGTGTVTDAFKPDQVPGASAPIGMGVASAPSADGTDPPRRRSCMAGLITAWAACIDPPLRNEQISEAMSAESDALNEQIKQSVALLRRHL